MADGFTYTVNEPVGTKTTRAFSWLCPSCGEILEGHSEPSLREIGPGVNDDRLEIEHAAFLDGFREFVANHLKEHAHA